jgi:hypothetical protein
MSAALANDGARGFAMLLVALLAIMLFAVIRAPGFDGSSPDDATRPLPAVPAQTAPVRALAEPALPGPQPADTATMSLTAAATGQPGHAGYTARHATGAVHGEGTIPRPKASGGAPWGQAPKPSGIR